MRWQREGTWARILAALQALAAAAGHALGRSRGGLSTKLHLAGEQGQSQSGVVVLVRV